MGGKRYAVNQKRVMPQMRNDWPGNAIPDKAERYRHEFCFAVLFGKRQWQSNQNDAPENANLCGPAEWAVKRINLTICFFAYTLTIANQYHI